MCEAYIGEIRVFAFDFAPTGWATCDGQLMSIQQNQALFAILGTTYGGDGITTFALPNLQVRTPMHVSATHALGQASGEFEHTLVEAEIPQHDHTPVASAATADQASPSGNYWAVDATINAYSNRPNNVNMSPEAVAPVGGTPHPNMSPYLVLNFCICLYGIFPPHD